MASTSKKRTKQVSVAQNVYRERMKKNGYFRLQEWLEEDTFLRLKSICERLGIPRRELLERLVDAAHDGNLVLTKDSI